MKFQGFQYIKKEDYKKDFHDLVEKLASSINPLGENVASLITNNINVKDNLRQEIKQVSLEVNSDGTPKQDTSFQSKFGEVNKIQGIQVIKAENLTNVNTYPTNSPFITYTQNGKIITIKHVTGLQINNKWKLTLKTILD